MQILSYQTSTSLSVYDTLRSRVLINSQLVPGGTNVNNEAEEERHKEIQDANAHPLKDIEFLRHLIESLLLFVHAVLRL